MLIWEANIKKDIKVVACESADGTNLASRRTQMADLMNLQDTYQANNFFMAAPIKSFSKRNQFRGVRI
jgi:hypothetical protein